MIRKEEIFALALDARSKSYSPYSKFKVGAVLIFDDDSYVKGCNVENASYGLSNCAERTAIFSAVAQGKKLQNVKILAIVGSSERPISPCGACRQVMSECFNKETKILLFNLKGESKEFTLGELLPYSFAESDLNE
jgi:cytidine deaminase